MAAVAEDTALPSCGHLGREKKKVQNEKFRGQLGGQFCLVERRV